MFAQRLRMHIDIEVKQDILSGAGEVIGSEWVPFKTGEPAEVLTGPGREFVAADAKQAETSARINFRWFPGLLATMRILWDGRVYNIQSIETDVTARKEWRTRCIEGVSDGD